MQQIPELTAADDLEIRTAAGEILTCSLEEGRVVLTLGREVEADVHVELARIGLPDVPALILQFWLDAATDALAAYDPIALGC